MIYFLFIEKIVSILLFSFIVNSMKIYLERFKNISMNVDTDIYIFTSYYFCQEILYSLSLEPLLLVLTNIYLMICFYNMSVKSID